MTNGLLAPQNYADPTPRPVPLWGQRANRAHINAVESFAPFAALILIAQVAGKADATTAFCAIAFFWLRLAHAIVYWIGLPYIRTLVFTLGGLSSLCFSCKSCDTRSSPLTASRSMPTLDPGRPTEAYHELGSGDGRIGLHRRALHPAAARSGPSGPYDQSEVLHARRRFAHC